MLSRNDFIGAGQSKLYIEDEGLIDNILDGIEVDKEPLVDLFYLSEVYSDVRVDFGGGVYGITCRDVIEVSQNDARTLREQLQVRNTKQNIALCEEVLTLCRNEVHRAGYIF
jgi:hypothetical protein